MTINNINAFMSGLWDWSILDGCFGNTKIKVTDIDGMVERNGNILMLEAKGPNVPVTTGQRIMFENIRYNPAITILVVWGNPGNPTHIMQYNSSGVTNRCECDLNAFRAIVAEWYDRADKSPSPFLPKRLEYGQE
ncbi:MAG TPA: hypothetical protein PK300_08395 [Bacillota bacterium]|nr:hypothetical protein [Bacillota bacterium]